MMNPELQQYIKELKQSFRQMMDGSVAQSMRDKGLNYHLNWGATLPRLQDKAKEIKDSAPLTTHPSPFTLYDLSIALWKENVRECKILATLLMPADEILPEVVDIWMEQIPSLEIAEQASFNLWQYLGFHVLSRLFMNRQEPNERGINEYLDQMVAALQGPYASVRKAAMQSAYRFAELGLVYERMAKSALKSINLELF